MDDDWNREMLRLQRKNAHWSSRWLVGLLHLLTRWRAPHLR
jgi:hypothetical protein